MGGAAKLHQIVQYSTPVPCAPGPCCCPPTAQLRPKIYVAVNPGGATKSKIPTGRRDAPFRSLAAALEAAGPHTDIILMEGLYPPAHLVAPPIGMMGAPLVIRPLGSM